MGVDAQMFVRIPRQVSDAEIREWSYRFGSLAHHWLSLGYEDKVFHKPLERIAVYEQDGPDIKPTGDETFLNVPLAGRYYGTGYERGDLLAYIAIAELLETLIRGCAIWYGGDSSGICAEPFTRMERQALLTHAATEGHDPYNAHFSDLAQDDYAPTTCPVCEVAMGRYGYGQTYALFRCYGCGWEVEYKDAAVVRGFEVSVRQGRKKEAVAQ